MTDIPDEIAAVFNLDEPGALEVTYTPAGGTGKTIVARMEYGGLMGKVRNSYNAKLAVFMILAADVPDPKDGDRIETGSEAWTVHVGGDFELKGNRYLWIVDATREEGRRFGK